MREPSIVENSGRNESCAIDSNARWRTCWDMASIFLTVAMLVCEPFIAAFSPNSSWAVLESFRGGSMGHKHESVVVLRLLELCWFSVDIILTFFTSYPHSSDGVEVFDLGKIARHYARGYLACDIFSTVPWETIILAAATPRYVDGHDALAFFVTVLPVARAVRVSKLAKAKEFHETMPNVSEIFGLSPAWDTLLWFTASVLMLNHWIACGWYALGDRYALEGRDEYCAQDSFVGVLYSTLYGWFDVDPPSILPDGEELDYMSNLRDKCTWLQMGGFRESSQTYLYVTSIYWSMTTLTTIGYGDITPNTINEKIYACVCYILGISMFASLVTSLQADIFNDSNNNSPIIISPPDSSKTGLPPPSGASLSKRAKTSDALFEREASDDERPNLQTASLMAASTMPPHQYSKSQQRRVRKALKAFMYKKKVPMDLSSTIMSYLRRHFEVEQLWGSEDEFPEAVQLLKGLPPPLLRTLALHLFYQNPSLVELPFFQDKPKQFIADCVASMRSYAAGPDEVIVPQGSVVSSLHLICHGSCVVVGEDDAASGPQQAVVDEPRRRPSASSSQPLHRKASLRRLTKKQFTTTQYLVSDNRIEFSRGTHFGEEGIILGATWLRPVVARGWCKMHIIPEFALHLDDHVDVKEELRQSAVGIVNKGNAASLLTVVSDLSHASSFRGDNFFVGSTESHGGGEETKDGNSLLEKDVVTLGPTKQIYPGEDEHLRSQVYSLRKKIERAETRHAEERDYLRRQTSLAIDLLERHLGFREEESQDHLEAPLSESGVVLDVQTTSPSPVESKGETNDIFE